MNGWPGALLSIASFETHFLSRAFLSVQHHHLDNGAGGGENWYNNGERGLKLTSRSLFSPGQNRFHAAKYAVGVREAFEKAASHAAEVTYSMLSARCALKLWPNSQLLPQDDFVSRSSAGGMMLQDLGDVV